MILRCTQKLLTVVGRSRLSAAAPEPAGTDWYANLLWFDGRKCVLVMQVDTLFSVFEPDVRAADLRDFSWWTNLIERELRAEDLPVDALGNLGQEDLVVAKTANRQILGVMNDLTFNTEHRIGQEGGLMKLDVPQHNHNLRRVISGARDYRSAMYLVEQRLAAEGRAR